VEYLLIFENVVQSLLNMHLYNVYSSILIEPRINQIQGPQFEETRRLRHIYLRVVADSSHMALGRVVRGFKAYFGIKSIEKSNLRVVYYFMAFTLAFLHFTLWPWDVSKIKTSKRP
jgi:hypothetical protein